MKRTRRRGHSGGKVNIPGPRQKAQRLYHSRDDDAPGLQDTGVKVKSASTQTEPTEPQGDIKNKDTKIQEKQEHDKKEEFTADMNNLLPFLNRLKISSTTPMGKADDFCNHLSPGAEHADQRRNVERPKWPDLAAYQEASSSGVDTGPPKSIPCRTDRPDFGRLNAIRNGEPISLGCFLNSQYFAEFSFGVQHTEDLGRNPFVGMCAPPEYFLGYGLGYTPMYHHFYPLQSYNYDPNWRVEGSFDNVFDTSGRAPLVTPASVEPLPPRPQPECYVQPQLLNQDNLIQGYCYYDWLTNKWHYVDKDRWAEMMNSDMFKDVQIIPGLPTEEWYSLYQRMYGDSLLYYGNEGVPTENYKMPNSFEGTETRTEQAFRSEPRDVDSTGGFKIGYNEVPGWPAEGESRPWFEQQPNVPLSQSGNAACPDAMYCSQPRWVDSEGNWINATPNSAFSPASWNPSTAMKNSDESPLGNVNYRPDSCVTQDVAIQCEVGRVHRIFEGRRRIQQPGRRRVNKIHFERFPALSNGVRVGTDISSGPKASYKSALLKNSSKLMPQEPSISPRISKRKFKSSPRENGRLPSREMVEGCEITLEHPCRLDPRQFCTTYVTDVSTVGEYQTSDGDYFQRRVGSFLCGLPPTLPAKPQAGILEIRKSSEPQRFSSPSSPSSDDDFLEDYDRLTSYSTYTSSEDSLCSWLYERTVMKDGLKYSISCPDLLQAF